MNQPEAITLVNKPDRDAMIVNYRRPKSPEETEARTAGEREKAHRRYVEQSIYPLGPKKYQISLRLGKKEDGRGIYHREVFDGTKKAAVARVEELLVTIPRDDCDGIVTPNVTPKSPTA